MPEPYALPSSPILLGQYRPPFRLSLVPMRHPSMFSAPHPCSHTHCATLPVNGLRARYTGSHAGLVAVPHPFHSPSRLCDFGNPEPYSHITQSRTSQPASSIAHASRCAVRVPPNASKCAPGFATRKHAAQNSGPGTRASHSLPMNPRVAPSPLLSPYGGSVTTACTLSGGMAASSSRMSPHSTRAGSSVTARRAPSASRPNSVGLPPSLIAQAPFAAPRLAAPKRAYPPAARAQARAAPPRRPSARWPPAGATPTPRQLAAA